jgi:glycosyltransferase involved in cell wall biosynthesis
MESKGKVSFVVPIYKTEDYLDKCLDSLFNQDYKDIEIVCIADGHSKRAKKIVKKFEKKMTTPIRYVAIDHSGVQKARNEGFKHTTGEFVSFWDSDCYAEPGMVRMWVKVFNMYPEVGFVYSGYRFNDEQQSFMSSEPFNPYLLTCANYIATMFPMRRELFPGFDESLKSLQDWDLWLTLSKKGIKGFWLDGSAFTTEMREGISSENCKNDVWLERYKAVREKHGIKGRDICFTSAIHKFRGIELAEKFNQDYLDMPGYHPNEYKMIYCIGFYANTAIQSAQSFKNAPKDCIKVIHWMGEDIESILMQPYKGVLGLIDVLKKTVSKHYCENESIQIMLKEIGIEAEVLPLPMTYTEVPKSEEFKVYYEEDVLSHDFVQEIIKANPDIKFENVEVANMKDYACFFSMTNSAMPSENLKRFIAAGRFAVTNYRLPYAGYVEPEREKVIKKIREAKKFWRMDNFDLRGQEYYKKLLSSEKFEETVIKAVANV